MAGATIHVDLNEQQLAETVGQLEQRLADLSTPLRDIGEMLLLSTDDRFRSQVSPDGRPWAPLSPTTLARKKGGRILRERGFLQDTIRYQVNNNELAIGTDRVYGAVHQFGQKKGASGRNKRGSPIPWGDIPARPFLGLSNDDRDEIVEIIRDYLLE
ncbi:hypothetical protein R84981_001714 [Carnimonas sp. R-84981]|uniref:phage virion morphogenesis protein n=1 Tax=Carnimonas bestiolae TaxID=3402172 RepID=UPI003EDC11BA